MSVIKISEVQGYVQGLIEAHPKFAAVQLKTVPDDGTYPKIPGLETQLTTRGLAIIVWRIGCMGMIDVSKSGLSNQVLHICVVIQENVTVNRGAASADITPTNIAALDAYQYVSEAISGKPKDCPPGTPIMPHDPPFENLGTVNGVLTIVADFSKQHRIAPL